MPKASVKRLRKEDIGFVFQKGKRLKTAFFLLWDVKKKDSPFRLSVVCSRKVEKRATKRNTIKRRIREVFRKDIAEKISSHDVIVQVLPAGKAISSKIIKETLYNVFHIS